MTFPRTLKSDLGILTSAVVVAAPLATNVAPASAENAPPGTYLIILLADGDRAYNWDHTGPNTGADKVDWPWTLFFYDNAEVDKVKAVVDGLVGPAGGVWKNEGDDNFFRQDDVAGFGWDSDRGMKDPQGNCPTHNHFRIYAQSDEDRNFNTVDGFYVFATSHKDVNHGNGCAGEQFGWSEWAENNVVNEYANQNYTVTNDAIWVSNPDNGFSDPNAPHRNYTHDGWASSIEIP